VASSGDEHAQPAAGSEQPAAGSAQPEAGNEQPPAQASGEPAQPQADLNWMKTESIRGSGESREDFIKRLRDPGEEKRRRQ
jgi:hypothetical protein